MRDQEAAVLARELATLRGAVESLRYQNECAVLEAATWAFDASQIIERRFRVPFAALAIVNHSAAQTLYVEAMPSRGQLITAAQAQGPGIFVVEAGKAAVFNTAGNTFTMYGGLSGELVEAQVFARPQSPAWR